MELFSIKIRCTFQLVSTVHTFSPIKRSPNLFLVHSPNLYFPVKYRIQSSLQSFSPKDTEILQKSIITLYLISDDTKGDGNLFFNSLDDIKNAFKINYSESNLGLPIFCKGYYKKQFRFYFNYKFWQGPSKHVTRPTRPRGRVQKDVLQLLKMINAKTKFIAIGIGVTVIFYFQFNQAGKND